MQNFLTLIVVGLLAAAGFEYYQHTQDVAAYIQQRDSLTASIAKLTKTNKDLKDEQGAMNQKLADLQKQEADLQSQAAPAPSTSAPATPAP